MKSCSTAAFHRYFASVLTSAACVNQVEDGVNDRLAHAAGQNYSEHIRQAVLADFWTEDLDYLRTKPVGCDMWEDWSDTLRRA